MTNIEAAISESTEKDLASEYLGASAILIVDSNSSSRVSLMNTLIQLGAKRHQMFPVGTMEEAHAEIKRTKPKAIFCDFMIGKESGLDLIQEYRQEYRQAQPQGSAPAADDRIFVLVTSNGSQSAVARAAEEDVDTFIIKPYTLNTFRKSLNDAIKAKLEPSEYMVRIQKGKEDLAAGSIDQALEKFAEAKKLDSKPSLACFYLGQSEAIKAMLDDAREDYREGLSHNKIHYKCLVGLFEIFIKQNKHEEAYSVIKRLAQYFPANPKRLATVLRLAIVTNNYDDIEGYYRIFTQLDQRTDELIRYICSALAVTGKYYLSTGVRSRAIELFDKVAVSCAGRIQFMRYAVETMVQYECGKEASGFLKKFPPETRGKPDYLIAELLVDGLTKPSGVVIQKARDLIKNGIEQPVIYRTLIRHSAMSGLIDSAENLAQAAIKKWPAHANDFALP
ncbi:MAG: response regulator [Oligoflexia bacterium]|nr:response regulator [Oligoflexia bacterium]